MEFLESECACIVSINERSVDWLMVTWMKCIICVKDYLLGINKLLFCQIVLCTMPTLQWDIPLSDLIDPQMVRGFDGDLKWHFTKLAGVKGIFDTNIEAFDPNATLVWSYSTLRIILLVFLVCRWIALFLNVFSESQSCLGINVDAVQVILLWIVETHVEWWLLCNSQLIGR